MNKQNERYRADEPFRERKRRDSRRQGWKKMGFDPDFAEAEYKRLHDLQQGLCAICRQEECTVPHQKLGLLEKGQRLALDHCSKTMRIRGLLCIKCNRGVGNFDDDFALLKRASEYLSKQ